MSILPEANSPDLHLVQPTPEEHTEISKLNSSEWRGILPLETYLLREKHLLSAPLAKDGGVTHWILVPKNSLPNTRPIFASCESLRKRAIISTTGTIQHVLTHGIGSVFCPPKYRGQGYAGRMMQDLGSKLQSWQTDKTIPGHEKIGFSILYSDIGKSFYANHGWIPFPSTHISFPITPSSSSEWPGQVKELRSSDLDDLCATDIELIEKGLREAKDGKIHVALIPDKEALSWHHYREEFICSQIFPDGNETRNKSPQIKGAITGPPGHRIWAIWTRNYYGPLDKNSGNTLHILRLVIEDEIPENSFSPLTGGPCYDGDVIKEKAAMLKAVLEVAKKEAREWGLEKVELWNPEGLVGLLVGGMGVEFRWVERERESIPCLRWYGEEGVDGVDGIEWVGNEKFGWC